MNNFFNLASSRRSIRKFEDKAVPAEDLEYFINTAVTAPSGCNSVCWKFVAIQDKEVIKKIADAVVSKLESLYEERLEEIGEKYLNSKKRMATFFADAPVVIAVFMTRMEYYDQQMIKVLEEKGYSQDKIMGLFAYPDILSIGAAVQNLLLAVHEKGYGACWMNDPAIAAEEIKSILGQSSDYSLLSLIPLGHPAYSPRNKALKPLEEVFESI